MTIVICYGCRKLEHCFGNCWCPCCKKAKRPLPDQKVQAER